MEEGQETPEDKERKGILEEEAACAQVHDYETVWPEGTSISIRVGLKQGPSARVCVEVRMSASVRVSVLVSVPECVWMGLGKSSTCGL